jgi:hypothetical protein
LADGIAKREFVAGKTKKDVIQKHKKGLEGIEKGSSGTTLLSGGFLGGCLHNSVEDTVCQST